MSLLFGRRLRGKASDWNWHNVIGFWSSAVLVVLTLTAAVMSYPWANDLLYTLTGSEPPPRAQATSPMAQAQQRRGAGEPREHKPLASFDAFLGRAKQQVPGWMMMMMRLPPRGDGPVTLLIQEPTAPHIFARSQLQLDRATTAIVKWEPYAAASTGRKLRIWVRGLHTGEALGIVGQTVAGLASLGGCFLVWTGFAMAWRRFRYRKRDAEDVTTLAHITAPDQPPPVEIPAVKPNFVETSKETTRIEMEQTNFNATNGHAHNRYEEPATQWSVAPHDGDSVLILYGTVTGNAEALATKLAAELRSASIATAVRDMAHCQANILTQANCVLMVVSTYGDGEPPDDAVPFWKSVVHGNRLDLRDLNYSVLALGNTTFDQFCKCGRDFDIALERHGANRIYPRVDCDIDYETPARHWLDGVLAHLAQDSRILSA
jgi:flavodoxin